MKSVFISVEEYATILTHIGAAAAFARPEDEAQANQLYYKLATLRPEYGIEICADPSKKVNPSVPRGRLPPSPQPQQARTT